LAIGSGSNIASVKDIFMRIVLLVADVDPVAKKKAFGESGRILQYRSLT
jgi:hypothetical protein